MPLTTTQQTEAYRFFAIAFNAAPGVEYMNQIAAAYEGGASTKQIVNTFTTKSVFTNLYPNFLTNEQFAARLIDNVVGAAATDAAKTEAKADVVAALAAGSSRGDVIFQIFTNLSRLSGDAKWGDMATKMANQVAVARYYTETLLRTTTDLPTLQAVLAGVDQTTVTTTAALEARLNPTVVGQTYTLTTGVDTVTGTAGDDIINGTISTASTLSTLDSINGGAGNDTLRINALENVAFASGMRINSVENVEIRGAKLVGDSTAVTDVSTLFADATSLSVTQAGEVGLQVPITTNVSVSGVQSAAGAGNGNINIQGGLGVTINNGEAGKDITVQGARGAVTITDTAHGSGTITVDRGTAVTVTSSGATTGALNIGQGAGATSVPTGAVSATVTGAAYDATAVANDALGQIRVKGGTSISVTANAYSSTATAAADTTTVSRAMGAVTVDANGTATSVTVNQTTAATAVNARAAVAGVREANTVTFSSTLANDASVTVNGITFTNKSGATLTAAQVASAFANLSSTAAQGSSALGVYSGAPTVAWSSGATTALTSTSSAVTFTNSAATTNAGPTIAATGATVAAATAGVTAVTARTGVAGVLNGGVTITDSGTTNKLASVTLSGYANSTVSSNALTSLSLANSDAGLTITNTTATSLDLTVNGLGRVASNQGLTTVRATVDTGATYTTLNVTTAGTASSRADITAAGVKTLNVSGTTTLDTRTSGAFAALETVTVTGAAGLSLPASASATIKSINTTATTGTVTANIDGTKATYTGGAGVDIVTLSATTVTKAVSLGAGDDSLTLAAGTTTLGAKIDGGDGTDTLVMAAADAATATATSAFALGVTGFEKLSLGQAAAANSVNLANMNGMSYVVSAGGSAPANVFLYTQITNSTILGGFSNLPAGSSFTLLGLTLTVSAAITAAQAVQALTGTTVAGATVTGTLNNGVTLTAGNSNTTITVGGAQVNDFVSYTSAGGALTLTNMANAGTLELTGAATTTTVTMTDATGSADSFNIVTKTDGNVNFGTVAVAGVETVNITATDLDPVTSVDTHTLTVSNTSAKSIVAGGSANLSLTAAATGLTSVNASALTGVFTFSSAVNSVTITGGAGRDVLSASGSGAVINGGAGNDTITVTGDFAVITGGAGNDVFNIADPTTSVNGYATITDFAAGDSIKFATGANLFKTTRLSLPSDTASFQDFANAAIASSTDGQISWFQFGGNTYLVQNATGGVADQFVNNLDVIVKLSGLIDLSGASLNSTVQTLQIFGG